MNLKNWQFIKLIFFVSLIFCYIPLQSIETKGIYNYCSPISHCSSMKQIYRFIKKNKNKQVITFPRKHNHPIYYFDKEDAKDILAPILKEIYTFELTDRIINKIFLEKNVSVKSDSKSICPPSFFKTEEVKQHVFTIAKAAYNHSKGHTLIIFGQTPTYLGVMIKKMNERNYNQTKIVNIPFSGHPNYNKIIKYQKPILNILTEERKKFFYNFLENNCDFTPEKIANHSNKIFILDNSSGPSIACFLSLIKQWFDEFNIRMPSVTYLSMKQGSGNQFYGMVDEEGNMVELPLNNIDFSFVDNFNIDIEIVFLGMKNNILFNFDKINDNLRIVPIFKSLYWKNKYLKEINKYPTFDAKVLIKEYEDYVEKHF
jgi:hypothetical protein